MGQFDCSGLSGWKTSGWWRIFEGMAKKFMALAALMALSGCSGFDESAEKLTCDSANRGDRPRAEACLTKAKQDYHEQVEAAKSQAKNR